MDEIYEWFLANLKRPGVESVISASTPEGAEPPDDLTPLTGNDVAFLLYRQKKPRDPARDMTPVCPRVTFNPALFSDEISGGLPSLASLFCCLCGRSRREGARELDDHTEKLSFTRKLLASHARAWANWT